jgi:Sec-independent protein translocase protein TatA
LGIFEILLFLIIALVVIPPDDLPQVMRAAGKVMRELRLASNTVMREISSAIGDELPYNLLPPRFDDTQSPAPPSSPQPAPSGFLAPEAQPQSPEPVLTETRAEEPGATQNAGVEHKPELEIDASGPHASSPPADPAQDRNSHLPATSDRFTAKP